LKLIVSIGAAADLDRLRAFLAGENPGAAQRAAAALIGAIQSLDTSPIGDGQRVLRACES
jgi:hypothetical protein